MPPVSVLIKPASSACNMNCAYCFYRDVSQHREHAFEGMLSLERMEKIIASAAAYAEGTCSIMFQGGEPTLAGLDFYRQVLALERRYARPSLEIRNAIQTNGYAIDEQWARFFAENRFLVGLSLDGPAEIHDRSRRDSAGKGTWNRVMRTARLFDKFHVEYNILCVLTGPNARSIQRIYSFFRRQGFRWLQFIPCLEPLDQQRGAADYHLSVEKYGEYLIRIFDLWYQDLKKGVYVSVRHLDNWLGMLLGQPPASCSMTGQCSVQFVVEGDGGVYPCDFYVLDELRLGTVGEQSLAQMAQSENARRFVEASRALPEPCRVCPYAALCRNGCRRDRLLTDGGLPGQNYYCRAYRRFFDARGEQLRDAARLVMQARAAMPPNGL